MKQIPITSYRDFYDIPRIFLVDYKGTPILFDCNFDESVEDFENNFKVFQMPSLSYEELTGSWQGIHQKATRFLGEIPTTDVRFDDTKRLFIESEVINKLFLK